MKKIIIFFPKLESYKNFHYVPYSALSVASKLYDKGVDVSIYDERVEDNLIMLYEQLETATDIYFTVYTGFQLTRAYSMSKTIKGMFPNVKITWGGPHVTVLPEQTLKSEYVDEVFIGYYETGEYLIPWHLVDIEKYVSPRNRMIYVSSYSCPGRCSFCSPVPKRQWKELPIVKVREDISNLMDIHEFEEAVLFDATIFTRKERARQIADIMARYELRWIADARACELKDYSHEEMQYFVDRGLIQLTVGLETGSQRVIDMMQKGLNHFDNFVRTAELLSKFNIKLGSGVVLGCPGETPDNLKETIGFVKMIRNINTNFFISSTFFRPLPGTEMSNMAKQYGYKEPETLAEWAQLGACNHYKYNEYQYSPWIQQQDEYKTLYDSFREECKDYFI